MQFLKQQSYNIVRLIVFQVGISIFSLVITFAMNMALSNRPEALNPTLLAVSAFSLCFYLVLIYSMLWEQGTKDKIRIESGRMTEDKKYGFKIALFAAIPNFIIAFLLALGYLFCSIGPFGGLAIEELAGNLYTVIFFVAYFFEAMLQGFIINFATDSTRYVIVLIYFIAPVIPILISGLAYRFGLREKRLLFFFKK